MALLKVVWMVGQWDGKRAEQWGKLKAELMVG